MSADQQDPGQFDAGASGAEQAESEAEESGTEPRRRRRLSLLQESGLLVIVALVMVLVIKSFFVQAFYIPSESMEPGLVKDDRILVQKPGYWFDGPQRGDVVVFADPGGWLPEQDAGPTNPLAKGLSKVGLYPTGGHLVKRVIAVAGDTVTCCDRQGRISVNGYPLDESAYLKDDPESPCNGPYGPVRGSCSWKAGPVPEGHVFVMGDNRNHSADSSYHMCRPTDRLCVPGDEFVDNDLVVGKVFALVWPAKRFTTLSRPEVFEQIPDAPDVQSLGDPS